MPRIIGIDPSLSRTGIGIIDVGRAEITSFSIPTKKKDDNYVRQIQALEETIHALHPGDIVIMEDFGVSAMYSASALLVERLELVGMLKRAIPEKTGYPFLLAMPSHLKGFIAGKVSAHKAEVRQALKDIWGLESGNTDEADALSLALLAQHMIGSGELDKKRAGILVKARSYRANPQAIQKIVFLQIDRTS